VCREIESIGISRKEKREGWMMKIENIRGETVSLRSPGGRDGGGKDRGYCFLEKGKAIILPGLKENLF
jgi:hypothetical protein